MSTKLAKNAYPAGHGPNDFQCQGPVVENDTKFSGFGLADLGCFSQEDVDSNKYYHISKCKSKKDGKLYVYIEFGRVGASKPSFQFFECHSEFDQDAAFCERGKEKNISRGQWGTVHGMKMFVPKPGKDLYRVQKLASRSFGLPDAKNICVAEITAAGNGGKSALPTKTVKKSPALRCDTHSTRLMRDLLGGAVTYTRTSIVGGTIPTQSAIDAGRNLIQAALGRIAQVGDDVQKQIADKTLRQITYDLYSRVPKIKPLHCPDEDWILSNYTSNARRQSTIDTWNQDLDTFETATKQSAAEVETSGDDPFAAFDPSITMRWIDSKSNIGQYLYRWWPGASLNRHTHVGAMEILNMWEVVRGNDIPTFQKEQKTIDDEMGTKKWNNERPLHQDRNRVDLDSDTQKLYWRTNTALCFHGTRTVNVPGIVRENLRLPNTLVGVVITGAMFGPGLYWADDWRKSDGYTSNPGSYWSRGAGSVKGRHAFMFAGDVIMGVPHVAPSSHGYTKPPAGTHCVFGKAGHSGIANNEWIVFQRGRNILRYLIEYRTGQGRY